MTSEGQAFRFEEGRWRPMDPGAPGSREPMTDADVRSGSPVTIRCGSCAARPFEEPLPEDLGPTVGGTPLASVSGPSPWDDAPRFSWIVKMGPQDVDRRVIAARSGETTPPDPPWVRSASPGRGFGGFDLRLPGKFRSIAAAPDVKLVELRCYRCPLRVEVPLRALQARAEAVRARSDWPWWHSFVRRLGYPTTVEHSLAVWIGPEGSLRNRPSSEALARWLVCRCPRPHP